MGILGRFQKKTPLTHDQQWAVAAGAVQMHWAGEPLDFFTSTSSKKALRKSLSENWGINDESDAHEMRQHLIRVGHSQWMNEWVEEIQAEEDLIAWMEASEPEEERLILFISENMDSFKRYSLKSWDLGRLINLARWCFLADYITEDHAWVWALEAASSLRKTYSSWDELGEQFCLGFMAFQWGELTDPGILDSLHWLQRAPESPWQKIPW